MEDPRRRAMRLLTITREAAKSKKGQAACTLRNKRRQVQKAMEAGSDNLSWKSDALSDFLDIHPELFQ